MKVCKRADGKEERARTDEADQAGREDPTMISSIQTLRIRKRAVSEKEKEERKVVVVQVELARIIIDEKRQDQVIVLKEKDGERQFPIVIGLMEASSIKIKISC